jgi:ribosomal protein L37AE/L43A
MGEWPYPNGRAPRSLAAIDYPLRPDPDEISPVPVCKHCSSTSLRPNGSYLSVRWDERRDAVICKDCGRSSYLPLGQHLPRKPTRAQEEKFIVADDDRPACPLCSAHDVQRKGLIHLASGGTSQRWFCVPCGKRFVSAAYRVATADHRKITHWDQVDAAVEAKFLYHYALRTGTIESVRDDIGISDHEKNDLEFLVADGVLPRAEVDDAIWFRGKVLEVYDGLVRKERLARARKRQLLADAGMVVNREDVLRFRDDMLQPFNGLVDAEMQILVESFEKKEGATAPSQTMPATPNLAEPSRDDPRQNEPSRTMPCLALPDLAAPSEGLYHADAKK